MEVTSRADLWGCSFNRYGDQSTLLLIDFLVSLHILSGHTIPTINVFPWVQDWEVAFFHHISQNMQTRFAVYYLCPCAHKGIVLVLCSWPPQHHLFSRLTVIPMSNTRWFLTSVRPDLKTDALQTWTSQIFLAGFLSHLVTSGRCAMWRKTQLRSVFLHWTAQCGQSGHCLKILAAKMTVLLINTSSGYSFCRS